MLVCVETKTTKMCIIFGLIMKSYSKHGNTSYDIGCKCLLNVRLHLPSTVTISSALFYKKPLSKENLKPIERCFTRQKGLLNVQLYVLLFYNKGILYHTMGSLPTSGVHRLLTSADTGYMWLLWCLFQAFKLL